MMGHLLITHLDMKQMRKYRFMYINISFVLQIFGDIHLVHPSFVRGQSMVTCCSVRLLANQIAQEQMMEENEAVVQPRVSVGLDEKLDSATLARLIEEVRNEGLDVGRNYDRTYNRHNR